MCMFQKKTEIVSENRPLLHQNFLCTSIIQHYTNFTDVFCDVCESVICFFMNRSAQAPSALRMDWNRVSVFLDHMIPR